MVDENISTTDSYEFSEEENKVFTSLTYYMRLVAIFFLANALIAFINVLQRGGDQFFVIYGITSLVLAVTFYIPIDNFKNITTTKGQDVPELLQGFQEINFGWTLVIVILVAHRVNVLISQIFTGG